MAIAAFPKKNGALACGARLLIRRYRQQGNPEDLRDHEAVRAEMVRRGLTEQFGILGWDDAHTSEDAR